MILQVRQCESCHRVLIRQSRDEVWKPCHHSLNELRLSHQIMSVQIFVCSSCLTLQFRKIASTAGSVS